MSSTLQSPVQSAEATQEAAASNEHADMLRFWEEHSARATMSSMFLDEEPFAYADEDTAEVLAVLPDVTGAAVVELGAGIGCASFDSCRRYRSLSIYSTKRLRGAL